MVTHYLKIISRNFKKHWLQSIAGILGISFAILCLVPSLYWIKYETSFDGFYPSSDLIYRIYTKEKQSGKINKGASKVIERKAKEHFPSIEASTTIIRGQENCRTEKMPNIKMNLIYADSSFFHVFQQPFVSGDMKNPLQVSNNIVITESMAKRLFGDVEKAIGQHLQTKMKDGLPPYIVTAVVKDPPMDTNLAFDGLVYHNMLQMFSSAPEEVQWQMLFMEVYAKFNSHSDIDEIALAIKDLPSELQANSNIEIRMLPLVEVRHGLEATSPFTLNFIGLFVVSGILLLVAAIFNFFNIYYDLFRQRVREINLRSVNGATVNQLLAQFLYELLFPVLLAFIISGLLIAAACPTFSAWLGIQMTFSAALPLLVFCDFIVIISIIIIGYILLWKLIRGAIFPYSTQRTGKTIFRRMAVSLQLFVSIVFIIVSLIVMRQMNFVNREDLGLDSENLVQLSGFVDYSGNTETKLINEIKSIPSIVEISDANFEPRHEADPNYMSNEIKWEGCPSETPLFSVFFTDSHFAKSLGLTMADGDWWAEGQQTKVVLNEEAVRRMELKNPVGTIIRMPSETDKSVMANYEVAGVVKDFHALSFRNSISPMIFVPSSYKFNTLYIRTEKGQEMEAVRRIKDLLPKIDSNLTDAKIVPVRELYDRLNSSEQVGLKIFSALSLVCLLVALCGVYAVASASVQGRRREIAIRKVMGAEVKDVASLFFREYLSQVVLAGLFALPISYLVMNHWLQDYAYRTNIPIWLLLGVVLSLMFLVCVTIIGKILNAANRNPALELKRE